MSHKTYIARTLAPEDIRPGAYVAVLHVVDEFLPHPLFLDDVKWKSAAPIRVRWLPSDASTPMKVKAVCLPFVFARTPDGKHHSLDVRRHELAAVPEAYAREVFRADRGRRQAKRSQRKHK